MEEIGQLRIFVPDEQFSIYQKLGRNFFSKNSQFFVYCAITGKRKGYKQSLKNKHELFQANTLSQHEWTVLKSIYYDDENVAGTYKDIITKAQDYASGGFEWLMNNEFRDFVHFDENYLLTGNETEFQIKLIDYTLNHKNEVPF
ncbi:hypothetical protein [Salimicrobium humidisoli]|uniref:Uncharacterized protein n=1 Tax=Salimicrobium humidisoli TaxID=2029857 RepID=A0ABX4HV21_9BACI|nr:hypothetical protein [Salimicrobium humidisoli]PBB06948.1 hypothetical protein CKW00_00370 [Salimicrobium humidisoli]